MSKAATEETDHSSPQGSSKKKESQLDRIEKDLKKIKSMIEILYNAQLED